MTTKYTRTDTKSILHYLMFSLIAKWRWMKWNGMEGTNNYIVGVVSGLSKGNEVSSVIHNFNK